MRKILFIISLFTFTAASAQVAKWVIHPSYEHIRMLGDGYYIVSQGDKYGILDATEKEIVPLQYDSISPFNSHMGLLFNEGKCIGYTSDKGEIHEFTAHQYKLGSMSRFSDGYLAVHNSTAICLCLTLLRRLCLGTGAQIAEACPRRWLHIRRD